MFWVVRQSARQREAIWDEHEAIAKAIAAGDVKQAVALTEGHAKVARENLIARLGEVMNTPAEPLKTRRS